MNKEAILKRLIYVLILIMFCPMVQAIDWKEVTTPLGKTVSVDLDSIKEADGFYFYNIRVNDVNEVVTIQSNSKRPFSAKIDTVPFDEYTGNYDLITKNKTKNLEPVSYVSVVYSCYKLVKETLTNSKNSLQIVP